MRIYFTGKLRGFFRYLIEDPPEEIEYIVDNNTIFFETNSKLKNFLRKIYVGKIGDSLGLIQRSKINFENYEVGFSYNRFLEVDKSYIITLENPTALYHYSLNRKNTFLGKKKLKKYLMDKKLKAIIPISKACQKTIPSLVNNEISSHILIRQIYPLIPLNKNVSEETVKNVLTRSKIHCLFISTAFALKSGYEIIEAFKKLDFNFFELTIITPIKDLGEDVKKVISGLKNVNVIEFNLNHDDLFDIYSKHDILLHPTRQDSFPLVILEALKNGLAVLGTDLYGIKEMVNDDYNGFLIRGKYQFYDENDIPNPSVWNKREQTIYSSYIDENIVIFLIEKLNMLNINREKLFELRMNSYLKASTGEFSEAYIKECWKKLYREIKRSNFNV